MTNKNIWIILGLLVLAGIIFFATRRTENVPPANQFATSTQDSTTINLTSTTTSTSTPNYTIEKIDEKTDPAEYNRLLTLGLSRKASGNYSGAAEAWISATKLAPTDFLAYNNLGDLYAYYLHDNTKAEANFALAVKYDPRQISVWRSFYEFYRNVVKNDAKAKATLQAGITANPNTSASLKSLLDNYTSAQ